MINCIELNEKARKEKMEVLVRNFEQINVKCSNEAKKEKRRR